MDVVLVSAESGEGCQDDTMFESYVTDLDWSEESRGSAYDRHS